MGFALQLQDSLRHRESQVQSEFAQGDALELILSRYLLAVEAEADSYLLTSILLVDGPRLRHGAAPSLPEDYCEAINGLTYGPSEGSCGTAAYRGHPVYVTDIATDPLWEKYKDLALQHGLRACWSTPVFDDQDNVIATFAIYHLTTRGPTQDEIDAIRTITDHVARAIMWSRNVQDLVEQRADMKPPLKLV
jgi:GAF domain-containing protein